MTDSSLNSPPATSSASAGLRLFILGLLIFTELMMVSLNFDAYLPELFGAGEWFAFLAYAGQFAKALVAVIAALSLAIWSKIPEHFNNLKSAVSGYRFYYYILFQLIAFVAFYWSSERIFDAHDISTSTIVIWFISLLALVTFWLASVAPWHYWLNFLSQEKLALILSLLLGVLAWWLARSSQNLWGPLSNLTFFTSAIILGFFYSEIFVDVEQKILGTQDFLVNIAPSCSGYEGIGLVVIFTAFYLSIYKKEFRFPNALLLFPIGIFTIWLFNAIRIALLIVLGSSYSPDIALGGFHSQAGWIAFILVIFGLLMTAHKLAFFSRQAPSQAPLQTTGVTEAQEGSAKLASALLIPFIVLLASTRISSSFSADFEWLYPLRVLAVATALLICWKAYAFNLIKLRLEPILAGVAVFIFWVLMIPNDLEQNSLFGEALFSAPTGISTAWLAFRFIGAVVTVPLAEELLFRGYLFARLSKQEINLNNSLSFSWPGLLFSSVLFGILHSNIIAGILAGLVYGMVRYRSKSILDAVIAHSVTNLLLSVMVLTTAYWSIW